MESKSSEFLKILSMCVLFAVAYGIVHDLFSVSFCIEYLRDYHTPSLTNLHPVALAIVWGVWATWFMGVIGGVLLGAASVAGNLPIVSWRRLVIPVSVWLTVLLVLSFVVYLAIFRFAGRAEAEISARVGHAEFELRRRLVSAAVMHMFSYTGASVLIGILSVATYIRRSLQAKRNAM
jgi:hypothetical protein